MNVLVIGAGGKTGGLVVERAVAAGHTVTAFVHDAGSYAPPSGVRVATGDAAHAEQLDAAMDGQTAVVDAIGGKAPYKESDLERTVATAVINSMKRHGVKRLLVVSVLGAGDSTKQAGFIYQHLLMPTFLRGVVKDKNAMEQIVDASGIDFVLVRPPVLTDKPAMGNVRIIEGDATAHKITRADVAQFLVDQLTSDKYIGQAVTIANT